MYIYKKTLEYTRNMKLKTKLNITYIILIIIPILVMSYGYYMASCNIIMENVENNAYKVVKNNNKLIDLILKKVRESSDAITIDHDLFTILNSNKKYDDYELVQLDKEINNIIYKFFPQNEEIYSVHLVTSYYNFGSSRMFIPKDDFPKSDLYNKAMECEGKLCWIPTYDFTDEFNQKELKNINLDYQYLFSAVKMINSIDVVNYEYKSLPANIERPVLIINFKPDVFDNIVEKDNLAKGSKYYITSKEGNVVYDSDKSKVVAFQKPVWLSDAINKKSGIVKKNIDGKNMIVCFDIMETTGWISAIVMPIDVILKDLYNIKAFIFLLGVILIVLCVLSGTIISLRITKPIDKLLIAIKDMGQGKFASKIEVHGNDEIGNLVQRFNDMDEKIKKLIEENYISRIREKEATIMALNIQLNPHFLYNTLNIINWMAIENGQKEISKMLMKLSSMLQYTVNNNEEVTNFRDDFEWLKSYIYIMENRFEGKFITHYNIDPELCSCKVPKLFLQPFVENAIIHGFKLLDNGGILNIAGWIDEDKAFFSIEDNGIGMDSQGIEKAMSDNSKKIGIKNVDIRIKLLYGEGYGVNIESKIGRGTYAVVILPLQYE